MPADVGDFEVIEKSFATKDDLDGLRDQINSSFCEVANMFLELQSGLAQLNERISLFNSRSSHKI
jgi:hypothetical protein